jgi:hypothetical protein
MRFQLNQKLRVRTNSFLIDFFLVLQFRQLLIQDRKIMLRRQQCAHHHHGESGEREEPAWIKSKERS